MDTCFYCGEDKEDVEFREDPYTSEIYHEIVYRNFCQDCYTLRKEDR